MTTAELTAELREERLLSPSTRIPFFPLVVETASGMNFTDAQGREFLDFHSMACVANLGHNHPAVVDAVHQQADRLICCNSAYALHEPLLQLAERLTEIPTRREGGYRVAFGHSGSDANDGALKLVRAATGRWRALAFNGSYHGNTFGALSLSASDLNMRRGFGPQVPGISHVPFPDVYRSSVSPEAEGDRCLEQIRALFERTVPAEEVAAVFVEPIQGDSGILIPPPLFLRGLSSLCAEYGILLVADEVQTGMGRTGTWLAGEHFGFEPDVVLLGKALGSGLPISSIIAGAEVMAAWKAPGHVFSTGGNPISASVALATLQALSDEDLLGNATRRGEQLRDGLRELQGRHEAIGDVRGLGLLTGVDLVTDRESRQRAPHLAKQVLVGCFNRGLFLTYLAGNVLRLVPPLIASGDDIGKALEILDAAVTDAVEGKVDPAEAAAIVGW